MTVKMVWTVDFLQAKELQDGSCTFKLCVLTIMFRSRGRSRHLKVSREKATKDFES